nr:hypothetical protein [Tanacetum cinerariifolium]
MVAKITDQDLEISSLKARVKFLEDKDRGSAEPTQEDAPIKGGIIDIWEEVGAEKSTKLGRNETEEMVNVLNSIEDANILTSTVADASVSPAAGVSIAGVPLLVEVFPLPVQFLPLPVWSNEVITKHLQEYEQAEVELTVGEKNELINELVKYQDHHAKISNIKLNRASHSQRRSRGKKFIPVWKQLEDFVPMFSKEEGERVKRKGLKLDQGSAKRMKTSEDVSEEDLKGMMQLVPLEEVYIKAMQVNHPIIDWEIHSKKKREYWKIIRRGVLKTVQDEEMIEASSPGSRSNSWEQQLTILQDYLLRTGWRFEGDIKLFVVDVRLIRTLEVDVGLFGVAASVTFMPCFRRLH